MITILILTVIYSLSVFRCYFWFKNAYSKGGIWSTLNADKTAVFLTVMPLVNTLTSVLYSFDTLDGKEKIYKNGDPKNSNDFFNIKKD